MKTNKVISRTNAAITITKGNKKIDPKALFGIWANEPRTLGDVRKNAYTLR